MKKLGLASEEDAEYVVVKGIRDGVIEGRVDHEGGWLEAGATGDVYSTGVPSKMFGERTKFCLQLHNESVKVCQVSHWILFAC